MKKRLLILAGILILTACAPTAPATEAGPSVEEIVAATMQALTAAAPPPTSTQPADGMAASFQHVSFVLPTGLATNVLSGSVPEVKMPDDGPIMANAPEHVKFEFDNYALYDTFHDAQILVFPAQEYAAMNENAADNIAKLQAILNGTAAANADNLPHITTFNAAQAFAAHIQMIKFANGSGVSFLTEYSQYFATANNKYLFYNFQGLTDDGKYYILAILPVSHPLLAYDENPETVIPEGGVPFPGYDNPDGFISYYDNVVILLDQQAANSFMPALTDLDRLIESIVIAP